MLRTLHLFLIVVVLAASAERLSAQTRRDTACHECLPPGGIARGGYMDVNVRGGGLLQNATSVKRVIVHQFGRDLQGLRICYDQNQLHLDTTITVDAISEISYNGVGGLGQTVKVPVLPAKELYRNQGHAEPPQRWLAVAPFVGYAGQDTSRRAVGSEFYFGAEALISPFGDLLGKRMKLSLALSAMDEGARLRFPIGGDLRWSFLGLEHTEDSEYFYPSPCQFTAPGEGKHVTAPEGFAETPQNGVTDPNVYYLRDHVLVRDPIRPFVYAEGGAILNGSFAGAGKDPSVNPDDYGQYYWGLGAGLPLSDRVDIALGYRYQRLNVRTPCAICPGDLFVQNTNVMKSVVLRAVFSIF